MASDIVSKSKPPEGEKTLTAQCHCKSVRFTVTVLSSSLPLATHLCHCHICRYGHGTLCCFHAPLPSEIAPQFIAPSSLTSSCTGYQHAQSASERFFCKTCGCHIGDVDLIPDPQIGVPEWRIATSIFSSHDDFQIRSHVFTASHHGPSLSDWLPLPIWNPAPADPTFPIPHPPPPPREFDPAGHERLRAECHCGGVSFTLPRPTHPALADNKTIARYVSKTDPNKWVACLDVCDDCRLTSGAHVVGWTFVPLASLEPRVPEGFGFGTLVSYASSEGVLRAFCGVCGATVFYSSEDPLRVGEVGREETMVDVAVGILRSAEGPAAEDWVTWRTGRVAFLGDGVGFDRGFAEALDQGFKAWAVERHGEVLEFNIPLL
ncbi:glutathione-dependent formaldehyde-activating enzyme [Lasiosphaeria hispida]|uniref:Glutathione-dependent formaldehyde-activating enzyme n=1 Tax=Lasiosphaeria hispida TaxID=260671 RepID=A0AAJ0HK07_9PEZI|nr:glutathione-dependent formaldehyde-activating enzyme [Lasiosphaeria hispida]